MRKNPRILNITFKSFRHFGGSWLAHVTEGNVLAVKKALHHKRVENTMKYIHRLEFQDPENYDVPQLQPSRKSSISPKRASKKATR